MTALRAALGAVSGGLEGARMQDEAKAKLERERAILERQAEKDALEAAREERIRQAGIRNEERDVAKIGMIPASQYTGLNPRDMLGATPRSPVLSQAIDGKEFVLPESESTVKHREGAMKMMGDRRALQASLAAGEKAGIDPEKLNAVLKAPPAAQSVLSARLFPAPKRASDGGSDSTDPNISKIIAGAGKIVASDRAQEARLQSRLQSLENRRPDPTSSRSLLKTEDELKAEEAAWQSKVDAVEKELETVQGRLARTSPVYEPSLVSRDTTGYGAAFGSPAAKDTPAKPPTYNTKEAALSAGAQRKISEIQSSDLTPEEKQVLIEQTNDILKTEILKLRGSGR